MKFAVSQSTIKPLKKLDSFFQSLSPEKCKKMRTGKSLLSRGGILAGILFSPGSSKPYPISDQMVLSRILLIFFFFLIGFLINDTQISVSFIPFID